MTIKLKKDKKVDPDKPNRPYNPIGKVKLSHRGAYRINNEFGTSFNKGDCLDVLPARHQYHCTCRGGGLVLWAWQLGRGFHLDNCPTLKLRCLLPKGQVGKTTKRKAFDVYPSDIDDGQKLVDGADPVDVDEVGSISSV